MWHLIYLQGQKKHNCLLIAHVRLANEKATSSLARIENLAKLRANVAKVWAKWKWSKQPSLHILCRVMVERHGDICFISCTHLNLASRWEVHAQKCHFLYFLSGILAKSGPLYFATKKRFPLFFCLWKGLGTQVSNHILYLFPNSLFLPCYKPKTNFAQNWVSSGDRMAEIYGFWEAHYS